MMDKYLKLQLSNHKKPALRLVLIQRMSWHHRKIAFYIILTDLQARFIIRL